MKQTVLIGGASGFWGDSQIAVPQLLRQPGLQYLVFDYLAETTMSILQRARLRAPELGYATDFVTAAVGPHLADQLVLTELDYYWVLEYQVPVQPD